MPVILLTALSSITSYAVIRDGGVDPANLGKGGWLYKITDATNHLGGNVQSVTSVDTLFTYMKSQGLSHVIVKAGTSNMLWTGAGNVSTNSPGSAQFTAALVQKAHTAGLLIFGSNRSYGADLDGENNVAKYIFDQGADGFIWDAEAEWETKTNNPWITNGSAQAWYMCSSLRAKYPTKFLAHNPIDIIYLHSTFPFKEFGYWSDCVMPQTYHHSASQGSASAAIAWSDLNWQTWQTSLSNMAPSVINGQTIYWTNSIKPLLYMREIYGANQTTATVTATPPEDITEFVDYMVADTWCPSPTGFMGANWFRTELYDPTQWPNVKASTIGNVPGVVNSIVVDDASAARAGAWTMVRTIACTIASPYVTFYGEATSDIDAFGTNYWRKSQGSGSAYVEFPANIVTAGDYNAYQWHPTRSDASASVPVIVNCYGGPATVYANQQTNGGAWSFLGRFPFAAGSTSIRVSDATLDGNLAMADGVKLVFVPPASLPAAPSGLTATPISSAEIDLGWKDNSTNETGFWVALGTVSGGPYTNRAFVGAGITNYSCTNLTANTTYYFVVSATNYLGSSASSAQASSRTFTGVPTPPGIETQPLSQTAVVGASAAFSVSVSGTPPFSYQWRQNDNDISGATSSAYANNSVQVADAGTYTVVVTNVYGSITSAPVTLTVLTPPPNITAQPQSQSIEFGNSASFSVTASGPGPLSYQWQFNGNDIASATNSACAKANLQLLDSGSYSVLVSNPYGTAASSNAVLTVFVILPSISSQPQSQTLVAGQAASFTAAASGTPPLSYQWRFNGANLAAATSSILTLSNVWSGLAGVYSVTVSNLGGSVTSSNATLSVSPAFKAAGWTRLWSLGGGSRSYLAATNHTERGLAYDVRNNRVLVVSRASSAANIYALNGDTGADLNTLAVPSSVISGGTYTLLAIGVADDGVVFAGNLTTGSSAPFRLYRWADDNAGTVPTLAYSGDPVGNGERWGDTLAVRGAGTNTQIVAASRSGTNVVIFSTANGTTFTPHLIAVAKAASGNLGLGLAFGAGNSFWGKANAFPLRQVSFDLSSTVGTGLQSYTNNFPTNISPIGVSVEMSLLAGIAMGTPDSLNLYDVSATNGAPVLIASTNFATANLNSYAVGAVDFASNRVYALDANNGILAMQITAGTIAPSIAAQPQSQTVSQGASASFVVGVNGTAPFAYQWQLNGADLAGATGSALSILNAQPSDAATYTVVCSNSAGAITSAGALLSVLVPPPPPQFVAVPTLVNGQLHFAVDGATGSTVYVDRSTNLITWEMLTHFVSTNGTVELIDSTTNSQSFYRVHP